MRKYWFYIVGTLLAMILGALMGKTIFADAAPVLSGDTVFLTLHFPQGQDYGCLVWSSEGQPDYTPMKCGPLEPTQTSWIEDWSFINCTMGGPAYCPDGDWWTVKGFTQTELPNGQYSEPVYSNTLRLKWVK